MSNLWIYTPDGFYSSRQDDWCEEDEVMIRSRAYVDLINLAAALGIENPRVTRLDKGDYLYRMKIKIDQWTVYCAHAAMNFDDDGGIKDYKDFDRYMAYCQVWEIMQWLQAVKDAELKGKDDEVEELREQFAQDYGYWSTPDEATVETLLLAERRKKPRRKRVPSMGDHLRRALRR
jgi:hypothetical protein